jgi:hypothetical protein
LYVELEKDKTACLNHDDPALRFDFNGDCVVNLADFAELALGWAQCNVYPDCY